jgi:hypothetical protein
MGLDLAQRRPVDKEEEDIQEHEDLPVRVNMDWDMH